MSDDRLVPLKKTFYQGQAHIIRSLLESNDIPCFVFDDGMQHVGFGMMEIRIMVPESYLPKANQILKNAEKADEV